MLLRSLYTVFLYLQIYNITVLNDKNVGGKIIRYLTKKEGNFTATEHIGKRLGNVTNRLHRCIDNEASRHGVTRTQSMILRFLSSNGGEAYQRDIEQEFGIRRSTVTNVLKLMEKNGLICRFSDENDGRMKRIRITDRGICANERVNGTVTAFEKRLKDELTEEKTKELFCILDTLEKCLVQIENETKEGRHL